MTFSDTVSQYRQKQAKNLKQFVTYSLAGSLVLHGVGLALRIKNPWALEPVTPEEIVIIVSEDVPPEELPEVPPEEIPSEPTESTFAAAPAEVQPEAATIVEAPAPPIEPILEEELEETPEPDPVPLVEDEFSDNVTEEPIEEPEVTETPTERRDLSNLLEELRRNRERTRQAATSNTTESTGTAETAPETAATAPSTPGSSVSPGGEGNEPPGDADAGRGNRSREISCEGCNFDYPEQARGAEGTAQVIVETDDQGRVVSVTLSQSSGNPELDRAALEQARERVRLEGAGAGESYPIDIDFVQPGSRAADRARERGDRRSITVSEPDPEPTIVDVLTPETPASEDEPLLEAEPSVPSESTPAPTPDPAASPASSDLLDLLNQPQSDPEPPQELPEAEPFEEEAEVLPPTDPLPEFVPEPEPIPEPTVIPEPEPVPDPGFNSVPEFVAPEPIPEGIQE
jgi:TonB family protein